MSISAAHNKPPAIAFSVMSLSLDATSSEERRILAARLEGWPRAWPCRRPSFEMAAQEGGIRRDEGDGSQHEADAIQSQHPDHPVEIADIQRRSLSTP